MSTPEDDTRAIVSRVEEAVTYPILTREIGSDLGMRSNGSAPDGGSLGRVAQQTLRDLLGWRYRSDDPAGFTAALSKAFTPKPVDGYVQWEWKQQSFSLQADLGAITGAQASIHAQARTIVEHVLPLLDALKPLRADVDAEDSESIRNITRSALQEIVNELATRSGPRVRRVDGYLQRLVGQADSSDAVSVGGHLGEIRDRFGLLASRVNTVEEERNLTNFIVLVDQLISLATSWRAKRNYFTRTPSPFLEPFLGTQLVQLAEVLDVLVEQVHETYAGMDSVFFGAAERQTTRLRLEHNGEADITTVAELLGWVESFAASEGRQLLQNGGKDGVVAFHHTLKPIAELLRAAASLSGTGKRDDMLPSPYVRSFHASRVCVLLDALASHAEHAVQLASEIQGRANMPRWLKEWLDGLYLDSLHCDPIYVRSAQKPVISYENKHAKVTIDSGKNKIVSAAVHVFAESRNQQTPQHRTITSSSIKVDQKTLISFNAVPRENHIKADLVLLTASNRVIHIEDAFDFNQERQTGAGRE